MTGLRHHAHEASEYDSRERDGRGKARDGLEDARDGTGVMLKQKA
ncbi:MAG: hypothetical protein ABI379_00820 [Rhodanobacter sp.]